MITQMEVLKRVTSNFNQPKRSLGRPSPWGTCLFGNGPFGWSLSCKNLLRSCVRWIRTGAKRLFHGMELAGWFLWNMYKTTGSVSDLLAHWREALWIQLKWFQIFFMFTYVHPYLGRWFNWNHQLEKCIFSKGCKDILLSQGKRQTFQLFLE